MNTVEPSNYSTYQNGTNKSTELTDKDRQPEFGMTSSAQGEVIPISPQINQQPASSSSSTNQVNPTQPNQNQTVFPTDTVDVSAQLFWYTLSRRHLFGAPILRWLIIALLLLGTTWFLGSFPGRWIGITVAFLAALYIFVSAKLWSKRDFVRFTEEPAPTISHLISPLDPKEKLPIFATGRLSVEEKHARFTWISGFYRTFATREHAIMCLVQEDQFEHLRFWTRLGQRNPEHVGMWYLFLTPDVIDHVRYGQLNFGSEPHPALAIDYTITVPAGNYIQRIFIGDKSITETLYLGCESDEIRAHIYADLMYDLPQTAPALEP